ncbi:MAG TPA: MFS transporter [Armatimonadota bacterium]|nr:MFS transporter [Armatimonadota bacterium]
MFAQLGWATMNFSALPVWIRFELNRGQEVGLILSAFLLTEAIFRPSLGSLSDKIGRKPLMLAGPFLGIFTSIATIYTGNIFALVLLRAIDGIGLAAFWPAAFAAIGDAVEEKHRSTAMSVLNGTGMAGIALGFPLGGLVNDLTRSHWGAFVFVCSVFTISVIGGLLIFPRIGHKHEYAELDDPSEHIHNAAEFRTVYHMIPDMIVLSLVVFTAIGLLMPIVKLYAMEQLGMSETQFGLVLAPVAATLGLLSVPFGRLADRWGKLAAVCYGMCLCAVAMWSIAVFRSVTVAAAAGAFIGAGFALAFPAWMAVVSLAAPACRRGKVMGAVGMAQGIGAIIGSAVGSFIYATDWLSLPRLGVMNRNLPFYLSAVLLSAGTVIGFCWVSRLRCSESFGRRILCHERKGITAAALIGLILVCGGIVFRYTRPVPPDRVAWLWVQSAVHGDAKRAKKFTLPSFEVENQSGETSSEVAAEVYYRWATERKAYYVPPSHPKLFDNGNRAEVRLVFRFEDRTRIEETIVLKKQPTGEWKVADKYARKSNS